MTTAIPCGQHGQRQGYLDGVVEVLAFQQSSLGHQPPQLQVILAPLVAGRVLHDRIEKPPVGGNVQRPWGDALSSYGGYSVNGADFGVLNPLC